MTLGFFIMDHEDTLLTGRTVCLSFTGSRVWVNSFSDCKGYHCKDDDQHEDDLIREYSHVHHHHHLVYCV